MMPEVDYAENVLQSAQALARGGLLDEALDLLKITLASQPDSGRLWELRGLVHRERGERAQAQFALETASLLTPLHDLARCTLAECYAFDGRHSLALDLFNGLIAAADATPLSLLRAAAALDHIGEPCAALRSCRRALQIEPDNAQVYYDMGCYAARCGYPGNIVESLARKAISLEPACAPYRLGLSTLLLKQQRAQEAYALVRNFVRSQIAEIACRSCLERLTDLFEQQGDWSRAALCREHAFQLAAGDGDC